jgi:hypothetical protein
MSFKPGKIVAALTKVMPDVGAANVIVLKTELLSKDALTLAEAAACLTKAGIPPAKVVAVRVELSTDPLPAAPAAPILCTLEVVVVALTKAVPDLGEAILDAVSAELLGKDEFTIAEAVTLLLGCGVSPAQVFDVREELDNPKVMRGVPVIAFADLREMHPLNEGAFGTVWKARRGGHGHVVVKSAKVGSLDRGSIAKELGFLRAISRSGHTNVARILAVCLDMPGGNLGLVMDYFPLGSLKSFLKTLKLSQVRVCNRGKSASFTCLSDCLSLLIHRSCCASGVQVMCACTGICGFSFRTFAASE